MSGLSECLDDEENISVFIERVEDEDDEQDDESAGHNSTGLPSSSGSNIECGDVIPDVPVEAKPNYLMRFHTIADAALMYKSYAKLAGFDVRESTSRKVDGIIVHKYLVCSRNGKHDDRSTAKDVMHKRNSTYKACECKAKIVVKRVPSTGDYKFESFFEMHNHELDELCDLRSTRKLSFFEKEFIVRASTVKIGATKAFKLQATLKGGFVSVNGKVADYKNFKRDMGCIIGYKDAQLLVNKMIDRKENFPNYSFDYKLDENQHLNSMFWADETEKAYFKEFGDVISFDATFRTNKYGLVFVPFTAIDHHKSSISVGAGLLSKETIESYKWLLEQFLKAHGGKEPSMVLTDQDPAIRQAIISVLPGSKHRWCMWHIMKKLQAKLSVEFLKSTDFKTKFKKIVWDMNIEPDIFEMKWETLMKEFKLDNVRWFKDIYINRASWIPAYFKSYNMCGLMKTTSRSESMNSFFNSYSQSGNFLVNFMLNYDNAIQKQRHSQRELDHSTKRAKYNFKSPLALEKHASEVYTSAVFFDVQKEIVKAGWFCYELDVKNVEGWEVYIVLQRNKRMEEKAKYKVEFKVDGLEIICSCDHFKRYGILCKHIFKILMKKDFKEIPEIYVLNRWRKDIIHMKYNLSRDRFDERGVEKTKLVNEAFLNLESCIDILRDDKEKLTLLVQQTRNMLNDVKRENIVEKELNTVTVEKLIGVSITEDINIKVPDIQNNKGCGTKRLVSEFERAVTKSNKKTRICSGCGKREPHNYRTCPTRIAALPPEE